MLAGWTALLQRIADDEMVELKTPDNQRIRVQYAPGSLWRRP